MRQLERATYICVRMPHNIDRDACRVHQSTNLDEIQSATRLREVPDVHRTARLRARYKRGHRRRVWHYRVYRSETLCVGVFSKYESALALGCGFE